VCRDEAVEADAAEPIFASEHPNGEEQHQDRKSESCREFARHDPDDQQDTAQQDELIDKEHAVAVASLYCTWCVATHSSTLPFCSPSCEPTARLSERSAASTISPHHRASEGLSPLRSLIV